MLCDPSNKDPSMKTIGVSYILSKGLSGEVERRKSHRQEIFSPKTGRVVKFTKADVQHRLRALMAKRAVNPKSNRVEKVYAKERKVKLRLPELHPYIGKTRKELAAECATQTGETPEFGHYATSWNSAMLTKKLLEIDRVEIEMEEQ